MTNINDNKKEEPTHQLPAKSSSALEELFEGVDEDTLQEIEEMEKILTNLKKSHDESSN